MTRHDFLKLLAATPFGVAATPNPGSPARNQSSAAGTRFPEGVTAAVVDFITRWPPDRVPARAVLEAKRCLVDGFGVVLAGATVEGSRIVREYIQTSSAAGYSTILGVQRASAAAAHAALSVAL
jgi:MmgE/PrpD N-terminal domain